MKEEILNKNEGLKAETVNLEELIEGMVEEFQRESGKKGIELVFDKEEKIGRAKSIRLK